MQRPPERDAKGERYKNYSSSPFSALFKLRGLSSILVVYSLRVLICPAVFGKDIESWLTPPFLLSCFQPIPVSLVYILSLLLFVPEANESGTLVLSNEFQHYGSDVGSLSFPDTRYHETLRVVWTSFIGQTSPFTAL